MGTLDVTLNSLGLVGRQAGLLSFEVPFGVTELTVTFDDLSTQSLNIWHGPCTIDPAVLNRPRIRRIEGELTYTGGPTLVLDFVGPNPALVLDFTTGSYEVSAADPSSPGQIIVVQAWDETP